MSLTFIIWKWLSPGYRTTYTAEHVNLLASMFRHHCSVPYRLICVTDDPTGVKCETFPLWSDLKDMQNPNGFNLPCCYLRLKLFETETTRQMEIEDGSRVVSFDLDTMLMGDVAPLFNRPEPFVGWKGVGAFKPVVYNGSLFMFRAGEMGWLWSEFDPKKSPLQTKSAKYFGSDQGWLSFRLANGKTLQTAPGWDVEDGVFSYSRDLGALSVAKTPRIVFFNGKHKPWDEVTHRQNPWIKRHLEEFRHAA